MGSSANISGSYSETSTRSSEPWGMYSLVLKHKFTPKTHFVFQHDHGFAGGVLLNGVIKMPNGTALTRTFTMTLRPNYRWVFVAEWFRDSDGFRVFSPAG